MIWDDYQTARHVLRQHPGIVEVNRYAGERGWAIVSEDAADPDRGMRYEVAWLAGKTVTFHYAEDDVSRTSYIYLAGRFGDEVAALESESVLALHPWPADDLVHGFDDASSGPGRGRALLRLALGSPRDDPREVIDRVIGALGDPDPEIRRVAVYATTYSPRPEYREPLESAADGDPDNDVRQFAAGAVRAYGRRGV